MIKMCSIFSNSSQNCQFKFTATWLREPENCSNFIKHLKSCHEYTCLDDVKIGQKYNYIWEMNYFHGLKVSSSKPPHQYWRPRFYRFRNRSYSKEQIFFRIVLLKVDSSGNKILSFGLVQLTPVIEPLIMRITIKGNANPRMVAKWGANSSSDLSWNLQPIWFNEFKKMVEVSANTEKRLSFPFSLPISFLAEYYVGDDGKFVETMSFELRD